MAKISKRTRAVTKGLNPEATYELAQAVKMLKSINASLARKHWPFQLCIARLWLGEALLLLGESEPARKAARDALRLARAMPSIHLQAHAHLLLARAASSNPDARSLLATQNTTSIAVGLPSTVAEASAHLEKALDLAHSAGAKELLWRIHLKLAKLAESAGDSNSARSHAREVLERLSSLESRVPPEMLERFRAMPERARARAACESMIGRYAQADDKHSCLTVGELDDRGQPGVLSSQRLELARIPCRGRI